MNRDSLASLQALADTLTEYKSLWDGYYSLEQTVKVSISRWGCLWQDSEGLVHRRPFDSTDRRSAIVIWQNARHSRLKPEQTASNALSNDVVVGDEAILAAQRQSFLVTCATSIMGHSRKLRLDLLIKCIRLLHNNNENRAALIPLRRFYDYFGENEELNTAESHAIWAECQGFISSMIESLNSGDESQHVI